MRWGGGDLNIDGHKLLRVHNDHAIVFFYQSVLDLSAYVLYNLYHQIVWP